MSRKQWPQQAEVLQQTCLLPPRSGRSRLRLLRAWGRRQRQARRMRHQATMKTQGSEMDRFEALEQESQGFWPSVSAVNCGCKPVPAPRQVPCYTPPRPLKLPAGCVLLHAGGTRGLRLAAAADCRYRYGCAAGLCGCAAAFSSSISFTSPSTSSSARMPGRRAWVRGTGGGATCSRPNRGVLGPVRHGGGWRGLRLGRAHARAHLTGSAAPPPSPPPPPRCSCYCPPPPPSAPAAPASASPARCSPHSSSPGTRCMEGRGGGGGGGGGGGRRNAGRAEKRQQHHPVDWRAPHRLPPTSPDPLLPRPLTAHPTTLPAPPLTARSWSCGRWRLPSRLSRFPKGRSGTGRGGPAGRSPR